MNMNDLKSGEPFFNEWYIEAYLGETQSGSAFKIYRECNDQREYSIMKVMEIPRDEKDICADEEDLEADAIAHYYEELVTDIYREICLLEKLTDHQHIVSHEEHVILKRKNRLGYDIFIRTECLDNFCDSINATFMTCQDIIHLGKNICDAIDLCDKNHIVHGDIRPDCIYLSEHGQYKLGDFTFLHYIKQIKNEIDQCQYSEYTAPEIMAGQPFDSRADIYSLGLVLYCYVNNNELPTNLVHLPLPKGVSKEFGQVILKACEQSAENRFQTAQEFKDALIAIGVFMGEDLTNQVRTEEIEEAEVYIAATQEDCNSYDMIVQQEEANKQLQDELQHELRQEVQQEFDISQEIVVRETSVIENRNRKIAKQELQPCRISNHQIMQSPLNMVLKAKKNDPTTLKKTKNMGPWILMIWVSVLTIAVLVLLLRSDLGLKKSTGTSETLQPTQFAQREQENNSQSLPTPTEFNTPTQEPDSSTLLDVNDTNEECIMLSGKGLTSLTDIGPVNNATIIDLSDNAISDLTGLETAMQVETLKLNKNKIKDLNSIIKLEQLVELDLSDNQITSIKKFKNLTSLEVLSLSNNSLVDITGLSKLTNLTMLYLNGNQINDIKKLASLKQLVFLDLSDNPLSQNQIDQLQKKLPDCTINY